jgi:hypothetical protein
MLGALLNRDKDLSDDFNYAEDAEAVVAFRRISSRQSTLFLSEHYY